MKLRINVQTGRSEVRDWGGNGVIDQVQMDKLGGQVGPGGRGEMADQGGSGRQRKTNLMPT